MKQMVKLDKLVLALIMEIALTQISPHPIFTANAMKAGLAPFAKLKLTNAYPVLAKEGNVSTNWPATTAIALTPATKDFGAILTF